MASQGAGFSASLRAAESIRDVLLARPREGGWSGPDDDGVIADVRTLGLVGPPGTGKSTVAGILADILPMSGIAVAGEAPMDGFHLSNTVLEELDLRDRKGAPETFDVDGYGALLRRLQEVSRGGDEIAEGRVVYAPGYRRDLHEPVAAMHPIAAKGLVITEGNYLGLDDLAWRAVRTEVDMLVYLDAPRDELLRRLVERHVAFGKDRQEAAHWVRTVDAANIELVESAKTAADMVVIVEV